MTTQENTLAIKMNDPRQGGMSKMEGGSVQFGTLENGDEVSIRYEMFNNGGHTVHVRNKTKKEDLFEARYGVSGCDDYEIGTNFHRVY